MFNNKTLLKEKLSEIKRNDYEVPSDIEPFNFALVMMDNIGSTDPELRDLLINRVISRWIRNVFSEDQLIELLNLNLDDNHLFYKIGTLKDDSVFMRTFCALNIGEILYVHRNKNFLSADVVKSVKEKLIQYYLKEIDLRGHVDKKGWADSTSHGADALAELALCPSINGEDLIHILDSIKRRVFIGSYTYVDFEDERITTVVINVINRNILPYSQLINWIKDFKNIPKSGQHPINFPAIMNTRNFLRSLYFRLLNENNIKELVVAISETLDAIIQY